MPRSLEIARLLSCGAFTPGHHLTIEHRPTVALSDDERAQIRRLCTAAYGEDMSRYLAAIGPGDHLLGRFEGRLASHLMWITRLVEPVGSAPLRTAYVELVATLPELQGRGYATSLLTSLVSMIQDFEVAALSPATEGLYARLGWRPWRGELYTRRGDRLESTPGECVMLLPLPRTPELDWTSPLAIEWRPDEVW